jgi:hypothetical protein
MKLRMGFVSNSSSASFGVLLTALTPEQLAQALDYHSTVLAMSDPVPAGKYVHERRWKSDQRQTWLDGGWTVRVIGPELMGCTDVDNFDFKDFLIRIGVPVEKIEASRYTDDCDWSVDDEET